MKTVFTVAGVVSVLTAGALGLAAVGSAEPIQGRTAADVISDLQGQGYAVQLNGQTNNTPLTKCKVTGVEGLRGTMSPEGMLVMTGSDGSDTVYVDISCPTLSQ